MIKLVFKYFFVFIVLFSFNSVFAISSTSSELTNRNVCANFEVALANSDGSITSISCYSSYSAVKKNLSI